ASSPDRLLAGDEPTSNRRLVVVSGPSGAGKSTVVAELARRWPFHFSVSATTRSSRPGEVDGVHYRFMDEPAFRQMVASGELVEWAEYSGRLYGTPRAPLEERLRAGDDVLLDIELQGARQIRDAYPEALLVFIAPPSVEELARRLRARGDTADAEPRLAIGRRQMEEAKGLFDYFIVNDRVDRAVEEIVDILSGTVIPPDRTRDQ
ncbi:MAG: guanylate kinase, partial [Acidimicrobiia bacterium]